MASPVKQYTKSMYDCFHYLATWLPTAPLRLGDIGSIHSAEFQRVTTLQELGISFKVRTGTNISEMEYSSNGAVNVRSKSGANANNIENNLSNLSAGVSIEFMRKNAFFFRTISCQISSIEDKEALGVEILRRYENDEWDKRYFVVTEIVKSGAATIIIANKKNARIDLDMKGNISSTTIDLADVNLNSKVVFAKDIHTQIITATSLTPLFRARSVKSSLFRHYKFRSDSKYKKKESMQFGDITPDDLLAYADE